MTSLLRIHTRGGRKEKCDVKSVTSDYSSTPSRRRGRSRADSVPLVADILRETLDVVFSKVALSKGRKGATKRLSSDSSTLNQTRRGRSVAISISECVGQLENLNKRRRKRANTADEKAKTASIKQCFPHIDTKQKPECQSQKKNEIVRISKTSHNNSNDIFQSNEEPKEDLNDDTEVNMDNSCTNTTLVKSSEYNTTDIVRVLNVEINGEDDEDMADMKLQIEESSHHSSILDEKEIINSDEYNEQNVICTDLGDISTSSTFFKEDLKTTELTIVKDTTESGSQEEKDNNDKEVIVEKSTSMSELESIDSPEAPGIQANDSDSCGKIVDLEDGEVESDSGEEAEVLNDEITSLSVQAFNIDTNISILRQLQEEKDACEKKSTNVELKNLKSEIKLLKSDLSQKEKEILILKEKEHNSKRTMENEQVIRKKLRNKIVTLENDLQMKAKVANDENREIQEKNVSKSLQVNVRRLSQEEVSSHEDKSIFDHLNTEMKNLEYYKQKLLMKEKSSNTKDKNIIELQNSNKNLKKELENIRSERSKQIHELMAKVKLKNEELETLQKESKMTEQNLEEDLKDYKDRYLFLKAKFSSREVEEDEDLVNQNRDLMKRNEELANENKNMTKNITVLKAAIIEGDKSRQRESELKDTVNRLSVKVDKLSNDKLDLENQARFLSERCESITAELNEEKENLKRLESINTVMTNQLDAQKKIKLNIPSIKPSLRLKPIEELKNPPQLQDNLVISDKEQKIKELTEKLETASKAGLHHEALAEDLERQLKVKDLEIKEVIQDNVTQAQQIDNLKHELHKTSNQSPDIVDITTEGRSLESLERENIKLKNCMKSNQTLHENKCDEFNKQIQKLLNEKDEKEKHIQRLLRFKNDNERSSSEKEDKTKDTKIAELKQMIRKLNVQFGERDIEIESLFKQKTEEYTKFVESIQTNGLLGLPGVDKQLNLVKQELLKTAEDLGKSFLKNNRLEKELREDRYKHEMALKELREDFKALMEKSPISERKCKDCKDIKDENENLKIRIERILVRKKKLVDEIEELEYDNKKKTELLEEQTKAAKTMAKEVEKSIRSEKEKDKKITRLQQQLEEELQNGNIKLEEAINAVKKIKNGDTDGHEKLRQENNNLIDENRNLLKTCNMMQFQLKKEAQKVGKNQTEMDILKKELDNISEEREVLRKQLENLTVCSLQDQEKYKKLLERYTELEKILEKDCSRAGSGTGNSLQQENVDELKKENSRLQTLIKSSTEQHSKKLGILTSENNHFRTKISGFAQSLQKEKIKFDQLLMEKDILKKKVSGLQDVIKEHDRTCQNGNQPKQRNAENRNTFECEICNKIYKSKGALANHRKHKHSTFKMFQDIGDNLHGLKWWEHDDSESASMSNRDRQSNIPLTKQISPSNNVAASNQDMPIIIDVHSKENVSKSVETALIDHRINSNSERYSNMMVNTSDSGTLTPEQVVVESNPNMVIEESRDKTKSSARASPSSSSPLACSTPLSAQHEESVNKLSTSERENPLLSSLLNKNPVTDNNIEELVLDVDPQSILDTTNELNDDSIMTEYFKKIVDVLEPLKDKGVDLVIKKREKLINKLMNNVPPSDHPKLVTTVDAAYKHVFPNYNNKPSEVVEEIFTPGASENINLLGSTIQTMQQQSVTNMTNPAGVYSSVLNQNMIIPEDVNMNMQQRPQPMRQMPALQRMPIRPGPGSSMSSPLSVSPPMTSQMREDPRIQRIQRAMTICQSPPQQVAPAISSLYPNRGQFPAAYHQHPGLPAPTHSYLPTMQQQAPILPQQSMQVNQVAMHQTPIYQHSIQNANNQMAQSQPQMMTQNYQV